MLTGNVSQSHRRERHKPQGILPSFLPLFSFPFFPFLGHINVSIYFSKHLIESFENQAGQRLHEAYANPT